MSQLPRALTALTLSAGLGLLAVISCTHTTDRVIEPVGGSSDASTTTPSDNTDASLTPIGPLARRGEMREPAAELRVVRAPEIGVALERGAGAPTAKEATTASPGAGGAGGVAGVGGSDRRPVSACGGSL